MVEGCALALAGLWGPSAGRFTEAARRIDAMVPADADQPRPVPGEPVVRGRSYGVGPCVVQVRVITHDTQDGPTPWVGCTRYDIVPLTGSVHAWIEPVSTSRPEGEETLHVEVDWPALAVRESIDSRTGQRRGEHRNGIPRLHAPSHR